MGYFSIWHRGKANGPWVLVTLKGDKSTAERELTNLHDQYRSGLLRLVDPGGIVLKREDCKRTPVAVG